MGLRHRTERANTQHRWVSLDLPSWPPSTEASTHFHYVARHQKPARCECTWVVGLNRAKGPAARFLAHPKCPSKQSGSQRTDGAYSTHPDCRCAHSTRAKGPGAVGACRHWGQDGL